MAESRSGLSDRKDRESIPGSPIPVNVRRQSTREHWQTAGWAGSFRGALSPLLQEFSLTALPEWGVAPLLPDGGSLLRVGPEQLIWHDVSVQTAAMIRRHADENDLVALDLSHACTTMVLSGNLARDVLASIVPIDLDPAYFPARALARTRLGQVAGTVLCVNDCHGGEYALTVPRSYAQDTLDYIQSCIDASTSPDRKA